MKDREKVIRGLECCVKHDEDFKTCSSLDCPYLDDCDSINHFVKASLIRDALELLKEQEPRVMTLKEVIDHYSLPPVFVDDLNAQEDYLQDIAPLYFDFPSDDPWNVHWRRYQDVKNYLDSDSLKESYGKKWRCWTGRPTDEQRQEVKWDAVD